MRGEHRGGRADTTLKLARALHVSPEWLLHGQGPAPVPTGLITAPRGSLISDDVLVDAPEGDLSDLLPSDMELPEGERTGMAILAPDLRTVLDYYGNADRWDDATRTAAVAIGQRAGRRRSQKEWEYTLDSLQAKMNELADSQAETPLALPFGGDADRADSEGALSAGPDSKRGLLQSPESKRGTALGPESKHGISGPESKRGIALGPESKRALSAGPESKRGLAPGPESKRAFSAVPESKRGLAPGPESKRALSAGPESKRGMALGPESKRGGGPGPDSKSGLPPASQQPPSSAPPSSLNKSRTTRPASSRRKRV